MIGTRKNTVRLAVGLLILSIPVAASYFGSASGGGAAIQTPSASTEVGYFSYSPKGAGGGVIIPASCELNYAHYAGECGTGCVSDGSCSAPTPACDQTTYGTDNCGNSCNKTGPPCTGGCTESWGGCGSCADSRYQLHTKTDCSTECVETDYCVWYQCGAQTPGVCGVQGGGNGRADECSPLGSVCGPPTGMPDLIPKDLNITF